MYPVNLNISGKLCLVVGGGQVALRKVRSLLEVGAQIRLVSPEIEADLQLLVEEHGIELYRRFYQQGDAAGAFCVFATTGDPLTQDQVKRDAKACGALLNSASDPEACDFQVPAQVRRGEFLLTVSTGGASPAFSRVVRQRLDQEFGVEYGYMSILMAIIRKEVLALGEQSHLNRDMFRALIAADPIPMIGSAQWGELEQLLVDHLPVELDAKRIVESFLQNVEESALLVKS